MTDMSPCIISLYAPNKSDGGGYPTLQLGGKTYKHHRVVYARSKGIAISAIAGLVIMHKCDNKLCVNPEHLSVGTQEDNMQDMLAKNRQASKLTPADVVRIRELVAERRMLKMEIAAMFGVSPAQITRIHAGHNWKHI